MTKFVLFNGFLWEASMYRTLQGIVEKSLFDIEELQSLEIFEDVGDI